MIEQNHKLAGIDIYFLKYILCIQIWELLPSDYSKLVEGAEGCLDVYQAHKVSAAGRERQKEKCEV